MAAHHVSPLREDEVRDMHHTAEGRQIFTSEKKTLSPVLVIMIACLFAFPLIVPWLPLGLKQYLDLLFR